MVKLYSTVVSCLVESKGWYRAVRCVIGCMVSKGITQGSVSGPHIFNLFWTIWKPTATSTMYRWTTRTTLLYCVVTVNERLDNSVRALTQFMDWTNNNRMKCNTAKCEEFAF